MDFRSIFYVNISINLRGNNSCYVTEATSVLQFDIVMVVDKSAGSIGRQVNALHSADQRVIGIQNGLAIWNSR